MEEEAIRKTGKMAKGRPPKPNAVKIAEGNPGKRPLPEEPALDNAKPRKPDFLDDEASKEWKRVVTDLHSAGLLKKVDTTILALYCQSRSDYIYAKGKIATEGYVSISPNGYPQKSAWVTIRDKAFDQIMKCLQELGMTPVARARVAANPEKPLDPFAEWFSENAEAPQGKTSTEEEDPDVAAFLDELDIDSDDTEDT